MCLSLTCSRWPACPCWACFSSNRPERRRSGHDQRRRRLAFFGAILSLAQTVGLPAFGVSAAWAGYQLMFSTSPRHQDGAKEQLKWSVIGLVIILAANQLGDLIKQAANATGAGGAGG